MKLIFVYDNDFLHDEYLYSETPKKLGWEIEHWSLIKWIKGSNAHLAFKEDKEYGKRIYIHNESEFDDNFNRVRVDNCFFIFYPYHSYDFFRFNLVRKIKKNGFLFANLTEEPTVGALREDVNSRLHTIRMIIVIVLRLFQLIFNLLSNNREKFKNNVARFFGVFYIRSSFNIVFAKAGYSFFPNIAEKWRRNNLLLCSSSYEYFQHNVFNSISIKKYVVFIDQSLIDMRMVNSDNHSKQIISDKYKYLDHLCKFFGEIEKRLNVEVVVAAHPKSYYDGNEFGDRKIIYNKTQALVKDSLFAIIQFSTVFSQILLYKKDFINIYCDDLWLDKRYKSIYDSIRKELKCEQLNFYDDDQVREFYRYIKHYDHEIYDKCVDKYVFSKNSQYSDKKIMDEIICRIDKIVGNNLLKR